MLSPWHLLLLWGRMPAVFYRRWALLALLTELSTVGHALTADAVNGGIAIIPLPDSPTRPEVFYHQHPVLVTGDGTHWQAVVGIDLDQKPGTDRIQIGTSGPTVSFDIKAAQYPVQNIHLNNTHQVDPDPEELSRIHTELQEERRDFAIFDGVLADHALEIATLPVPSHHVQSAFGLQRYFNGERRASHSGIDLQAAEGTPIHLPVGGRVLLAKNLFFNGNTVMIDEGQGVVSMYCHLSSIDVKPGDQLAAGQVIGSVGHTGRATGPHLHWSVSLNGVRVNPRLLLSIQANAELDGSALAEPVH